MALNTKTKEKIFNIGSGKETSVNEIAAELKKLTGSKVNPAHGPAVKGEVRKIMLDVKLAAKELGWRPKTGVREGLEETVRWCRNG